MAGSPRESLSPSHGTDTSAARRCSRDSLQRRQVGHQLAAAHQRHRQHPVVRAERGAGVPASNTTSSIAVPVGL